MFYSYKIVRVDATHPTKWPREWKQLALGRGKGCASSGLWPSFDGSFCHPVIWQHMFRC